MVKDVVKSECRMIGMWSCFQMVTQGLVEKEYHSRFLQGIWKVPDVSDETVIEAAKKAREARFEFGETPKH